jgi:hypothetical protein
MATVIVHLMSDDPFVAEVDELPKATDNAVVLKNPRLRDGKPLRQATTGMTSIVFPWHRISFVEIMGGEEERKEVVEFFRQS